jgi:hypothetical protein
VRDRRWVALPAGLTLALAVLLVVRIQLVRRRTGDWSGEDCVVGPYDPAERTYLYAITGVLLLAIVSTVIVAVRTRSRSARIAAIAMSILCGITALYVFVYVWGGLEYNNRPDPSMPCPFLNKDLHL